MVLNAKVISRAYLRALPRELPPELLTTDRVLQRWAVSIGSGQPTDEWDDLPREARPPPLDDVTSMIVDQVVCKTPRMTNMFLVLWYKTPKPVSVIAHEMQMRRESVYRSWALILNFMKWKFVGTRHRDLIELINRPLGDGEY